MSVAALRKLVVPAAVVLGIALVVVAVVYFVSPEHALPAFFPGHAAAGNHHHTKHGIAALVLALACFAFAWFQTGPKTSAADSSA